ncbi:hypothetical protein C882_0305 [Caenispirillum salinarum AK4]|uniref:Uncharacterized protein n=1 Tax=Caenispirillum salinarum AK4 TaxID=1238182 RepID=K9HG93_9PROT|nr:hypothetical protein [Caenispirillum salinarum]EKV29483.1 hypothetical protein C882_0305 [Caenispirillum salinarum AK4]
MTKRFSNIFAAAVAIAVGAAALTGPSASAVAGEHMKTLTSTTWKPGYMKDDDNRYIKFVMAETGADARTTGIESRHTWAPGFSGGGDGTYQRIVERDANRTPALVMKVEGRGIWAPGFRHEGNGRYSRVTYIHTGAASGTMVAGDAKGSPAEVAEAR